MKEASAAFSRGVQLIALGLIIVVGCDNGPTSPREPAPGELTVEPSAAPPGAAVLLDGIPAGVSAATHWVEVAGERAPLIETESGIAFIVPAFLDETTMWPAPPSGRVTVELMSNAGPIAAAPAAFTVQALQPAGGTSQALAEDLGTLIGALRTLSFAVPADAGEAGRMLFAISGSLDSLAHAADYSISDAIGGLDQQQRALLDALLAASDVHGRLERVARTMEGVAAWEPPSQTGLATSSIRAASESGSMSDVRLSQLMQLAVYLEQNTEMQSQLGSDLSAVLGLAGILGIDADRVVPIGKALDAIAVQTSMQAWLVRSVILSSLPSRLDSITLVLANDTIRPDDITDATIEVFASNDPQPVTVGDIIAQFQNVAGLFAKGDWFEKAALWVIGKANDLMASYAEQNPDVTYDPSVADIVSIPEMQFHAAVENRELLELGQQPAGVVEPLDDALNWRAVSNDSAEASIHVRPAVGEANIPTLMEWLADFVSENSGGTTDLVIGSFGEDIIASPSVRVVVAPPPVEVSVHPDHRVIPTGGSVAFTAIVTGIEDDAVTWSATGGSITQDGLFTAGEEPGTYHVTATSVVRPSASATATVEVIAASMITPVLNHRDIWFSRASVYAGGEIIHADEEAIFDSYSISTSSELGAATLSAQYTYDDIGSLREFRVQSTMSGTKPSGTSLSGNATFRLLFHVAGEPVRVKMRGTCTLEEPGLFDSHLAVRIHNEPSNNNFDTQSLHRNTAGPSNNCTWGWEREIEEIQPGLFSLSIGKYGYRDVVYDFTITFERIEEEDG